MPENCADRQAVNMKNATPGRKRFRIEQSQKRKKSATASRGLNRLSAVGEILTFFSQRNFSEEDRMPFVGNVEKVEPAAAWHRHDSRDGIGQNQSIGTFEPSAYACLNAIDYFHLADNDASRIVSPAGIRPFAGMNEKRSTIFCRPRPVFDVLPFVYDAIRPRLANGQAFHFFAPFQNLGQRLFRYSAKRFGSSMPA
jgi:hypothetical protein